MEQSPDQGRRPLTRSKTAASRTPTPSKTRTQGKTSAGKSKAGSCRPTSSSTPLSTKAAAKLKSPPQYSLETDSPASTSLRATRKRRRAVASSNPSSLASKRSTRHKPSTTKELKPTSTEKTASMSSSSASGKEKADEPPEDSSSAARNDSLAGLRQSAMAASFGLGGDTDSGDHAATLQSLLARLSGGFLGGSSQYKQMLLDLKNDADEFRQESALGSLTEMLLMGNEETLSGFRPDQFVPALHHLLDQPHRPRVALNACDALCNMLEAIPSSSATIATCSQSLCEKLLAITYMDLAERALTTIAKLSVDQGETLLKAGGLNSVLTFLDFFPMAVQRSAVQTAANMCDHASPKTFDVVQGSIQQLSGLLQHSDRNLVESACVCFSKLVRHCAGDDTCIRKIAEHGLLLNLLSIVGISPMLIGKGSISTVVDIMSSVLQHCPDMAASLHDAGAVNAIKSLICGGGPSGDDKPAANSSRAQAATSGSKLALTADQLGGIMKFTCELMPTLPSTLKFVTMPRRKNLAHKWEWRDGDVWIPYSEEDSKQLERTKAGGENLCNLRIRGQHYVVSLADLIQINRSTRTKRVIRRRPMGADPSDPSSSSFSVSKKGKESEPKKDVRAEYFDSNEGALQKFCQPLVAILFDLYLSTANPELKRSVMDVVVKMLFYASPELLRECLRNLAISTYLSNMLRESDAFLTVGALQMADILIQKLPEIFNVYFRRQGVLFQICGLANKARTSSDVTAEDDTSKKPNAGTDAATVNSDAESSKDKDKSSKKSKISSPKRSSSFGRSSHMSLSSPTPVSPSKLASAVLASEENTKFTSLIDNYILDTAKHLLTQHFDVNLAGKAPQEDPHEALDLLRKLQRMAVKIDPTKVTLTTDIEEATLKEIAVILADEDLAVSAFEINNSGLISALLNYLTVAATPGNADSTNTDTDTVIIAPRTERLKTFCSFFFSSGTAEAQDEDELLPVTNPSLVALIAILQGAINVTEKFPLKSTTDSDTFANHLKAPIKLKLERAESSKLKPMSGQMVMIEPFASIQAIEDFLWRRVRVKEKQRDVHLKLPSTRKSTDATTTSTASSKKPATRSSLGKGKSSSNSNADGDDEEAAASSSASSTTKSKAKSKKSALEEAVENHFHDDEMDMEEELDEDDSDDDIDDEDMDEEVDEDDEDIDDEDIDDEEEEEEESSSSRQRTASAIYDINIPEDEDDTTSATSASATASSSMLSTRTRSSSTSSTTTTATATSSTTSTSTSAPPPAATEHQKVQVLLDGHPLPSNITIYQAIQQYGEQMSSSELNVPSSVPLDIALRLSGRVYTIHYQEAPKTKQEQSAYSAHLSSRSASSSSLVPATTATTTATTTTTTTTTSTSTSTSTSPTTTTTTTTGESHAIDRYFAISDDALVLDKEDQVYAALFLLRALHVLNCHRHLILGDAKHAAVEVVHSSEFVNNNLASKITRQVSDLETICAASFPAWCQQLMTTCPFIVSFECKRLYFYYTAFGSVRALVYYQQVNSIPEDDAGDRALPGRLSRVKVRVSRKHLLKSACTIMHLYATCKSMLEVMFKDEVGTGLGPTLEFYALASKAWQKRSLGLWMEDSYTSTEGDSSRSDYVYNLSGLFPVPVQPSSQSTSTSTSPPLSDSKLFLFRSLGRFIARALLDGRLLDIPFNPLFLGWLLQQEDQYDLIDLKHVDVAMWTQFVKLKAIADEYAAIQSDSELSVEDKATKSSALNLDGCAIDMLGFTFTLPSNSKVELKPDGINVDVVVENLAEYIQLVVRCTLVDGVRTQMEEVRRGFSEVFPIETLKLFTVLELDKIIRGSSSNVWVADELLMVLKADHGYSSNSPQMAYLAEVMSDFDGDQQRLFLSFITGCPNLPVGGFKSLRPPLTVVRKSASNADAELPSVMTCQNYLKLPPYSSVDICRARLNIAMTEGQGSFDLS